MKKIIVLVLSFTLIFTLTGCSNKDDILGMDRDLFDVENKDVDDYDSYMDKYEGILQYVRESNFGGNSLNSYYDELLTFEEETDVMIDELPRLDKPGNTLNRGYLEISSELTYINIFVKESVFTEEEEFYHDTYNYNTFMNDDFLYYERSSDDNENYEIMQLRTLEDGHFVYEKYVFTGEDKYYQSYMIYDTRVGFEFRSMTTDHGVTSVYEYKGDMDSEVSEETWLQNMNGAIISSFYQKIDAKEGYKVRMVEHDKWDINTSQMVRSVDYVISLLDGYKEMITFQKTEKEDTGTSYKMYFSHFAFNNVDRIKDGKLYSGDTELYPVINHDADIEGTTYSTFEILNMNQFLYVLGSEPESFNVENPVDGLHTDYKLSDFTKYLPLLEEKQQETYYGESSLFFKGVEYIDISKLEEVLFGDIPEEYRSLNVDDF